MYVDNRYFNVFVLLQCDDASHLSEQQNQQQQEDATEHDGDGNDPPRQRRLAAVDVQRRHVRFNLRTSTRVTSSGVHDRYTTIIVYHTFRYAQLTWNVST